MPRIKDFKVVKTSDNYYDLSLVDNKIQETTTLETAILMSIFCEKRASESQVPINEYRRGWWGNILNDEPGYEIGSLFWLAAQRRHTDTTREFIRDTIKKSLNWLIADNFVSDITVRVAEFNFKTQTLKIEVNYRVDGRADALVVDAWKQFYRENV